MTPRSMYFAVAALVLPAAGCLSLPDLTLPGFAPRHPRVERRAYETYDPFADTETGPDTLSRPRGFETPRTGTRRAAEQRARQQMIPVPQYQPSPYEPQPGSLQPVPQPQYGPSLGPPQELPTYDPSRSGAVWP